MWAYTYTDELYHFGILGMKWGIRRYQNKDGSLTSAGRRRANTVAKREEDVKRLSDKRRKIQQTKGAATRSYINISKDILEAKGRLKIAEGKRDKNKSAQIVGKDMIKEAKLLRKPESAGMWGFNYKKTLYPSSLSKDDKAAITYMEGERYTKDFKRQRITGPLKVAAISVTAGAAISVGLQVAKSKGTIPLRSFVNKENAVAMGNRR